MLLDLNHYYRSCGHSSKSYRWWPQRPRKHNLSFRTTALWDL